MQLSKTYKRMVKIAAQKTAIKYKLLKKEDETYGMMDKCAYCKAFYKDKEDTHLILSECGDCPLDINGRGFGCVEQATYIAANPNIYGYIRTRIAFHEQLYSSIDKIDTLEELREKVMEIDNRLFNVIELPDAELDLIREDAGDHIN